MCTWCRALDCYSWWISNIMCGRCVVSLMLRMPRVCARMCTMCHRCFESAVSAFTRRREGNDRKRIEIHTVQQQSTSSSQQQPPKCVCVCLYAWAHLKYDSRNLTRFRCCCSMYGFYECAMSMNWTTQNMQRTTCSCSLMTSVRARFLCCVRFSADSGVHMERLFWPCHKVAMSVAR